MRHAILTSISTLLLAVAFAFLLLATISAPVVPALELAADQIHTYGIFGSCEGTNCSAATYPVAFGDIGVSNSTWLLENLTRNTLSQAFIVAPIATGMAFFAFLFTSLTLFADASGLKILSLVFTVFAFLSATIIAVMAILVFHPYVQWLCWLLVAAAACTLVAVPLLFLSVTAYGDTDDDSDTDTVQKLKFGDISKMDSHTVYSSGSFKDPKTTLFGHVDVSASNNGSSTLNGTRNYDYRGMSANAYGAPNRANMLDKSLLDSSPNMASDVTKPRPYMPQGPASNGMTSTGIASSGINSRGMASLQNGYSDISIQNGPNTPVSSNRQLAPNYAPSEGTTASIEPPNRVPYPNQDRASSIYTLRNYGVFDHHPSVEGHQPFTELQDADEHGDKNSLSLDLPLDSDGESDFTSVSQRPPNDIYNGPAHFQNIPPNQQNPYNLQNPRLQNHNYQPHPYQPNMQQAYHPAAQYQACSQTPAQSNQRPPGQYSNSQTLSYLPPPGQNYGQLYGAPNQHEWSPRPQNRPTLSENVLNNNPDFAIGAAGRRKQMGRPGAPLHRPNMGFPGGFARGGQRDGPYGIF